MSNSLVWWNKYYEKLKVNHFIGGKHKQNIRPVTKRERTELQKTKKNGCCCGLHSINGYKSRKKYPVWKKKSRKKEL